MKMPRTLTAIMITFMATGLLTIASTSQAAVLNLSDNPLFAAQSAPPLTLMSMGRDHKLYYEAYNDASDLNGDGVLDVGYKPADIDYYGYFGSNVCYVYNSGSSRFEPSATTVTKKCTGASEWSGDYLNYLTTARIDALRKVFYGGTRQTDTSSETVLERTHIPQDAHSWGKEYTDIATDGFDIREYSPLALPTTGSRHLFANTTLLPRPGEPLFRVLNDSFYRIWEWVSKERPVAGSTCVNGSTNCARSATASTWEVVPASAFQNLTISTYDITVNRGTHPGSHADYDNFVANNATGANKYGTGPVGNIDGSNAYAQLANPFGTVGPGGQQDNYLTIFNGQINIPTSKTYEFAVDGDDALEVIIDGTLVSSWYGGHCDCVCNGQSSETDGGCTSGSPYMGSIFLTAGLHNIEFRHEEAGGGDNYWLYWETSATGAPASSITDYVVRAQVCVAGLLETNCQAYPNGNYKPIGLLQSYGENDSMYFGLLTGSYEKNTSGGVLRKNVGSITDEINANDGTYTATIGVIGSMDRLRTIGFGGSNYYNVNCGWVTTRAINEGECRMWGNPVGEMMFEGMRYFAGKATPTPAYNIASSGNDDATLGLPLPSWIDPYGGSGFSSCSKPFQIVIADINPSYDTDQLPGTSFGGFSSDMSGVNVTALADTISSNEPDIAGNHFIGQVGAIADGAPTSKAVTTLSNIRGLAPEEPTKLGGYYSASVGYYGTINDINPAAGDQKIDTFSVALASPLPRIEIPVNGTTITLVPFAKSVGGAGISSAMGDFQPTNTIVDFYVDTLTPTYGKFTINYEDVEQGADHDMDAIVQYEYQVNGAGTSVTIKLTSTYAAGGIIQHMGYVISGTTADGIYLEVRDVDTSAGSDPDYFLDTPNTAGVPLPLVASRTFTPGVVGSTATLLKDPLWYAAKWGGFQEDSATANNLPDLTSEWDEDGDGDPDNYFLVTNALDLSTQLASAFNEIIARSGVSASAAALTSGEISSDTNLIRSTFNTGTWVGNLKAYAINSDPALGAIGEIASTPTWSAEAMLSSSSRQFFTHDGTTGAGGTAFVWASLTPAQQGFLNKNATGTTDGRGSERVNFLRGATGITGFRNRVDENGNSHILGDMVNSSPAYVSNPRARYPDNWGTGAAENASPYSSFFDTFDATPRIPMVYVGGNDGMLHGFNAETSGGNMGKEQMAYIPNEVFSRLSALTSPTYSHKFYVDGSPTAADAFFDVGNQWRTVLVGGLNRGGQAVYALDITNPGTNFLETNASTTALWEFSDANDTGDADTTADPTMEFALGYTYSTPSIVRLHNGKWAAIFGNGYNNTEADGAASTSGYAVLYIVDIEDGSVIRKINTKAGNAATPNGLATVTPVDTDGDFITDYVYAGDLLGNMWKFDLTASSDSSWGVAFSSGGNPAPLFVAKDSGGTRQAITARADVGYAANGSDIMIYFGTGKYLEGTDNTTTGSQTQAFYAITDSGSRLTGSPSAELLQQQVETFVNASCANLQGVAGACDIRVTTDNAMGNNDNGWYLELPDAGERVIYRPILLGGTVLFVTLVPSGDECNPDGTGWIMQLDALDGGRLSQSPFDLNGDGIFDNSDRVSYDDDNNAATADIEAPGSGRRVEGGAPTGAPAILNDSARGSNINYTDTTADTDASRGNAFGRTTGRQSWRQIK